MTINSLDTSTYVAPISHSPLKTSSIWCMLADSLIIYQPSKRHLYFAADDNLKFCRFFKNKEQGMIFHENRLLADDSHEI